MGTGYYHCPYIPNIQREYWERKFVFWPRRCKISNKQLWLTYAYQCVRQLREDVFIFTRPTNLWHSDTEHTMYLIKGN